MNWLQSLAGIAPIAAAVTASLAIVLDDRRWMLAMLGGEYMCLAWFTAVELTGGMATVKLLVGLLVCAGLTITLLHETKSTPGMQRWVIPSGRTFRLIAVLLICISAWGLTRNNWTPVPGISPPGATGSMVLIGLGLLHLGISEEPFRVGIGLLTTLAGFEVAYGVIEPSLAMMTLLAAVHLGIAVVVSYLIAGAPGREEERLGKA
ncbi:MAG: hypothetical protein PVJ32_09070 [Anaerolineales bacterium]|jgi:hypothetical protein